MNEMKKIENAVTETGRLKANVRNAIHAQAVAYLENAGFTMKENGRMTMAVALADGKVISVNLDVKIGYDTDFTVKATEKAERKTEKVDVGNLF